MAVRSEFPKAAMLVTEGAIVTDPLLRRYARDGWLPQASVALRYSPVMAGQHEVSLLVGPLQKGIPGAVREEAYAAIRRRSDCYRVERNQFPGGTFTHCGLNAFHGAHGPTITPCKGA